MKERKILNRFWTNSSFWDGLELELWPSIFQARPHERQVDAVSRGRGCGGARREGEGRSPPLGEGGGDEGRGRCVQDFPIGTHTHVYIAESFYPSCGLASLFVDLF